MPAPTRTIRPNPANMGGARPLSAIRLVFIHCTEGDTALGAAEWFARPVVEPDTEGSSHVVVDDSDLIRCVPDDEIAYGVIGYNLPGLHLEIAGFEAWTRAEWIAHRARLERAAQQHAEWNRLYMIPLVVSETHGYHSHAGMPGNDHTDPGPGFPWDLYRALVLHAGNRQRPEPPGGATLRVQVSSEHAVRAGWADVTPALRAIAAGKETGTALAWHGHVWHGAHDVAEVARHLLRAFHL